MYLDVFDRNPYGTNCWLLAAEGSDEVVVIDPGFEPEAVHAMLTAAGKRPAAVLLTHAHLDHAAAAAPSARRCPSTCARRRRRSPYLAWGGMSAVELDPVADLRTFVDGDLLRLAGCSIEVLHTPGHTPGSSSFRVDCDALILQLGFVSHLGPIEQWGLANSDPVAMRASLRRFLTLPDDMRVLPGHGPETDVGRERSANQFLQGLG
jgi:glyoxylase-like metal-dependent hydrolase (beta-lactamase superfamily II)